ncbi:MAG: hypothetical protein ACYTBV_16630 [Planctomycetota bacterium]|jgi:hypothetical protein
MWFFFGDGFAEEFGNLPVTAIQNNYWRGKELGVADFQWKASEKP